MKENNKKIETIKDFQTSINISYDLFNENKIKNFIPTNEAIKILEALLVGVFEKDSNKARILTGAYGRGKSHIILIFLSLLREKNIEVFKKLLEKMKLYDEELYSFIFNYLKSDKKYFPIIVNGGNTSLEQSFLLGIEEGLKREDIINIMPETNFDSAIKVIENWKENYENTYKNFILEIDESIESFILGLKNYEMEKYKAFEEIYKKLTSGAVFNPFIGTQVIDLYERVTDKLIKEKGYQGVYIVFDEFSKYLESNLQTTTTKDIKLLQDFAEKCDRNKNMHLLLITHKELSNYLDNSISKEQLDSWRGISGRFLQMTLSNDFSEMYEIISLVIKKDKEFWKEFKIKNKEKLDSLKELVRKNKVAEDEKEEEIIVEECYPLHPVSSFILPRLSEKIAQNERSLFTFLSSNQKKSLNEFIKGYQGDFKLITPEYLYDYFENILKSEIHTTTLYKNYSILKKVLKKVECNSLEEKILKTLFLIYLVDQFEVLLPTKECILEIYKYSNENLENIENAIEKLEKKECILYLRRSNNQLKIKETSGVDVQKEIEKYINKLKISETYIDILNKLSSNNYFYPNRYNVEKEMIRYFKFKFISGKEFLNTRNWKKRVEEESSDGAIFGIIYKDKEEQIQIEEYLKNENCINDQTIFVYLKEKNDIEKYIYEYYSALELKSLSQEDQILQEEYETISDDLEKIIFEYIDFYIKPEKKKAKYFYKGIEKQIFRKSQFSELLTEICNNNFYNTPIINNEVINKNIVSSITNKSRNRVIEKILNGALEYNLGFRGNGQEIFILRTLLVNTGILINEEDNVGINLNGIKDKNLKYMLNLIEEKIKSTSSNKIISIDEIYKVLTSIDYHIGIRKGIIPVYLAIIFYFYKEKLIIQKDKKDLKITGDLLSEINENPTHYELYLENWDHKKVEYISELEKIFKENIISKDKNYNNYRYIVEGIKQWYIGLPKYSKDIKTQYRGLDIDKQKVDKNIIEFRDSLRINIENSREYLFNKLIEIFKYSNFDLKIIEDIKDAKLQVESLIEDLEYTLISDLKNIFDNKKNSQASLLSILKDWTESLKEDTKNHIFSKNENKFIELINNSNHNEEEFIKKLAKLVTSLRIEDWNEKTIESFFKDIIEIKKVIEEHNNENSENIDISNNYKIIFTENNGKEKVKIFEKIECSSRAKLLFNEIENSIDEMGQSITDGEKRQVLIEILKKFC